jgi:hypothetical protein
VWGVFRFAGSQTFAHSFALVAKCFHYVHRPAPFNDRKTIQKSIPKKIKTTTAKVTKNCGIATDRKSQLVALFGPLTVLAGALWMVQTMYVTVTRDAPGIEVAMPAMNPFR